MKGSSLRSDVADFQAPQEADSLLHTEAASLKEHSSVCGDSFHDDDEKAEATTVKSGAFEEKDHVGLTTHKPQGYLDTAEPVADTPAAAFVATEEVPPSGPEFKCPSIPIMVIVLLIFSSFAQSMSSSVLSIFINGELGFSPVESTRFWMYIGYTAWVQPAIGWLADVLVI